MALPLSSLFFFLLFVSHHRTTNAAMWCVARIDSTNQMLQSALDYACAAGADCAPIQPTGLCYLPNTIQAHASYAFNSYFQRRAMAPGSCNFAGSATIARTDPSYGSCVYPSSLSTAGGTPTTTTFGGTPTTTLGGTPTATLSPPTTITMSPPSGSTAPYRPLSSNTDESKATIKKCINTSATTLGSLLMVFIWF